MNFHFGEKDGYFVAMLTLLRIKGICGNYCLIGVWWLGLVLTLVYLGIGMGGGGQMPFWYEMKNTYITLCLLKIQVVNIGTKMQTVVGIDKYRRHITMPVSNQSSKCIIIS